MNNEQSVQMDDMHGMLRNALGVFDDDVAEFDGNDHDGGEHDGNDGSNDNDHNGDRETPNLDANKFYYLLKYAEQQLYPGCMKLTKLSFIVRLFHIKCLYGLSDKSVTVLLELFKEALPEGETLPKSFYKTKKIITDLGLRCNKIDTCPKDCMLYWKEKAQERQKVLCAELLNGKR
ncbi:hypothetical protein ACOSQ3_023301 [Xanthoceras sorbifolium]